MSKSKKRSKKNKRQKTLNAEHDKKNMLILGITVATVVLLLYAFGT